MFNKLKQFFKKIKDFIKESLQELKNVNWPSKEDAINSSIITVGFILFFSLFLALLDYLINLLYGLVR